MIHKAGMKGFQTTTKMHVAIAGDVAHDQACAHHGHHGISAFGKLAQHRTLLSRVCPAQRGECVMGSERNQRYHSALAGCASGQGVPPRCNPGFEEVEMATYILLGGGFGLALAIAIWGIWKLR